MKMNMEAIREQFPALTQKVNGHDLVYLDSAATSLKPQAVVDRIAKYYLYESSNVHRGAHQLADQATAHFEQAREKIKNFLNAKSSEEIIFTKGTTESFNLIAHSYGRTFLKEGDLILLTEMEHHANIVPWQILAEEKKLKVEFVQVLPSGDLDFEDLQKKLSKKPKIVSFTACSNTLGTRNDVQKIAQMAKAVGAIVCVDAAQWVSNSAVDVQAWDVDFLTFSAHKIFGPTGFGALYGRKEILEKMPPYQGGGSMISEVTTEKTTFNDIPFRFEAGTPHIEGAIGTAVALEFFLKLPLEEVRKHEDNLLVEATKLLKQIPEIQIYAENPKDKGPILSFNLKGAHHSDVGQILDQMGVAVRAGHHCTQPLMKRLGIPGTVRASFSIYNQMSDVQNLYQATLKARELLL